MLKHLKFIIATKGTIYNSDIEFQRKCGIVYIFDVIDQKKRKEKSVREVKGVPITTISHFNLKMHAHVTTKLYGCYLEIKTIQ